MPEEINRILTDQLSDYLFAPTQTAIKNLEREHVFGKIIYSGDIAVEIINYAIQFPSKSLILEDLRLQRKAYILFTMHRAENTTSHCSLISIIRAFETLSEVEIVFPIHPRTANLLKKRNLYSRLEKCKNVKLIQPVNYIDFIKLMQNAKKVITDSGGVQKEAYLLSIPCITIRGNTEWIETVKSGWNVLTDTNTKKIVRATRNWMPTGEQIKPIFGDGNTSTIIKNSIMSLMSYEKVGR
jgi:UDP-N-acetylglucosamine 2-epimerase (non-hydrolysing)